MAFYKALAKKPKPIVIFLGRKALGHPIAIRRTRLGNGHKSMFSQAVVKSPLKVVFFVGRSITYSLTTGINKVLNNSTFDMDY